MKLKLSLLAFIALAFTGPNLTANPTDLNRDKRITWEEFEAFQQSEAKKNNRKFDLQQAKHLFEDKDGDRNGFLSYQEFARNPVDLNDDKSISFEEYSVMMKKRGERSGRLLKHDLIKDMFAKKDTDGNGSLSYQELAKPIKP